MAHAIWPAKPINKKDSHSRRDNFFDSMFFIIRFFEQKRYGKIKSMNWFLTYSGLFFIGGFCGWVLELFFRRFVSQKKWVNPGFLTGPLLPLYGFGVASFYLLANEIPWQVLSSNGAVNTFIEIVCIGASLTLLEFIAGEIFIRGMKIKLWDYSRNWGNYQGIICPLFSLVWTLIGAAFVLWLNPLFNAIVAWLLSNIQVTGMMEAFFYGILSVDLGWSFGLANKIRKVVSDSRLVVDWDKIKLSFQDHFKRLKKTPDWLLPFKTKGEQFSLLINEYVSNLRVENEERASILEKKIKSRVEKQKEKAEKRHKEKP